MVARAKTCTIEAAEQQWFLFATLPYGDQAPVCTFSRMARERPYNYPASVVIALEYYQAYGNGEVDITQSFTFAEGFGYQRAILSYCGAS